MIAPDEIKFGCRSTCHRLSPLPRRSVRSLHLPCRMKIAVIGSGVSGIGALWGLNEYSQHEVHLFEENDYLGGHTHTVEFAPRIQGKTRPSSTNVDTGFIVWHIFVQAHVGDEPSYISKLSQVFKVEGHPYSSHRNVVLRFQGQRGIRMEWIFSTDRLLPTVQSMELGNVSHLIRHHPLQHFRNRSPRYA